MISPDEIKIIKYDDNPWVDYTIENDCRFTISRYYNHNSKSKRPKVDVYKLYFEGKDTHVTFKRLRDIPAYIAEKKNAESNKLGKVLLVSAPEYFSDTLIGASVQFKRTIFEGILFDEIISKIEKLDTCCVPMGEDHKASYFQKQVLDILNEYANKLKGEQQ